MRAELGLPSVRGDDEKGGGMMGGFGGSMGGVGAGKGKRPINVKFEIPYFTTSGIQVRYLKIIEPKVNEFPPFNQYPVNIPTATISLAALGTVYNPVWRYRGAVARRQLIDVMISFDEKQINAFIGNLTSQCCFHCTFSKLTGFHEASTERAILSTSSFTLATSVLTLFLNSGFLSLCSTTFSSLSTCKSASIRSTCSFIIVFTSSCKVHAVSMNLSLQRRRWSSNSEKDPNLPVIRVFRRLSLPAPTRKSQHGFIMTLLMIEV